MYTQKPINVLFRPINNRSITFETIKSLAEIPLVPLKKDDQKKIDALESEYIAHKHDYHKSTEIIDKLNKLHYEVDPVGSNYVFSICRMGEYIGWFSMYLADAEPDNRVNGLVELIKEKCKGIELEFKILK